jgi:asparagine synthase (glutamine-hydrolysing)
LSGICGVIRFDGGEVEPSWLEGMVEVARHRGPDGVGRWLEGGVGLAHLALHVTPESVRESQPLVSREGGVVVVADARIDNRAELAVRLRSAGELRAGDEPTDAELILAAYRVWGEESAAQLVGDFAFVVWDGARRRLYGARDVMGMRALYYRVEVGRVLFGTEVKQILAVPGVPVRIFEPAVGAYLAGPYVLPEWTFYEGVEQLAPAHALVVEAGGHRAWRYWEVDGGRRIRYRREAEYAEHFLELFTEAVRARLRSVRPVGLFLSGGVDSGSIAAVAGRLVRYCWAFEELAECDERGVSGPLAAHWGIRGPLAAHWGIPVTEVPADEQWPLRDYPAHGPDRDDPFLFVYQPLLDAGLARARDQGASVVMSGDRGDLLMGENIYDYPSLFWRGQWRTLLSEFRIQTRRQGRPLRQIAKQYLWRPARAAVWPAHRAPRLRRGAQRAYRRFRPWQPTLPPWMGDQQANFDFEKISRLSRANLAFAKPALQARYSAIFTPMHLRGAVSSERMHAALGLAFADPWSDSRLISFVLAVPQRALNTTGYEKRVVKSAMSKLWPCEVRQTVGKTNPYPLFDRALRDRAIATVSDLLAEPKLGTRGWVDEGVLRRHYEGVRAGEPEHYTLWWALSAEMWLRAHFRD